MLPNPGLMRAALTLASFAKPLKNVVTALPGGARLAAMLDLAAAPVRGEARFEGPRTIPAAGAKTARVALLSGCAQRVIAPEINAAAIRLLTRMGVEVVLPKGEGCCGALTHHLGREHDALAAARANIDAWTAEIEGGGLDAILITASGCGTTVKDYGFMLRADPAYAEKAARYAAGLRLH